MNIEEIISEVCEDGEQWRPCPEFEEKYLVSSHGRVLSIGTYNTCKKGKLISLHKKKNRPNPVVQVQLFDSGRMKTVEVHILVAKAFIPNPMNYPIITHLDGNNSNNFVENLEWRTVSERKKNYHTKEIEVYDSEGNLLGQYKSITKAAEVYNTTKHSIIKCCQRPYGMLKGLQFRYKGQAFQNRIQYENQLNTDEVWKPIEGYESYQVSNLGRVKNSRGWLMKPSVNQKGYLLIHFSSNNKSKFIQLHRLVASAFLPNPENLPQVNHKDEDKTNNTVFINLDGTVDGAKSNLEWCDNAYNVRYSQAKKIKQFNLQGELLKTWEAVTDIEHELGIPTTNISKCCKGIIKTIGGFIFLFTDGNIEERISKINSRKHKSKSENVRQLSLPCGG